MFAPNSVNSTPALPIVNTTQPGPFCCNAFTAVIPDSISVTSTPDNISAYTKTIAIVKVTPHYKVTSFNQITSVSLTHKISEYS